jgi:N-acetyl-1-D-myo-inositol-2-amino-2-deoxy-alpha-D-glucopyranoside deacetylase
VDPENGESGSLRGRKILAVFAHPDDESLACGGTLARLADAGAAIVLMCLTHGERGVSLDPGLVPDGDLGRVRARELVAASRVLGITDLQVLDYPDGNLRWGGGPSLPERIRAAVERHDPSAIITFDCDGLYWHVDHIAVHERTSDVVSSLGRGAPALYYVTMPVGAMRHVIDCAAAKGWTSPNAGFWGIVPDAFGLLAEPPTFGLDVRPWVARKIAALACHQTQMGPRNPFSLIEEADARQWLGFEHFRRAPIGSGAPVLEPLGDPVIITAPEPPGASPL